MRHYWLALIYLALSAQACHLVGINDELHQLNTTLKQLAKERR